MDKSLLGNPPQYADVVHQWVGRRRKRRALKLLAAIGLLYFGYFTYKIATNTGKPTSMLSIRRLQDDFAVCSALRRVPVDPSRSREYNKRWVNGTTPVLIRNATVWTGEPAPGTSIEDARLGRGFSWTTADVLVDRGLILKVGPSISTKTLPAGCAIFEAGGRQLTAGVVDMHSHAGLGSLANLQDDVNELSSDITPYVQSLDGLNPLHPELQWIKSGGVTTSLLLPGSGNNMGGEAFVVKLATGPQNGRAEISQEDMLADPDKNWRYMKMACGENPKGVYGKAGKQGPYSRLGEAWQFRHALEQATAYVKAQNDWCTAAGAIGAENMATYLPQEIRWESLGALLRGQVRLNTHCYTIPDLESFVRHTNEFRFRLYAFHHAHQTYLVPEVLKRAWGGPPAVALFADNMYYKVEAYTASEQAGKILYDNGITPVYVSDNPVLNSQHVVFEAAKAYSFGLPYHAALAGVTSAPAELLGLGDRVGKIKEGLDADIVVWDSDPLSVGATPIQVWVDGAPQFKDPVILEKPISSPIKPDHTLANIKSRIEMDEDVVFTGVSRILISGMELSLKSDTEANVVISNGAILCAGICESEMSVARERNTRVIQLKNGHLTPPFTAFGSGLGLLEIDAEKDTQNGPYTTWSRAVDGLAFGGKHLTSAFEHGVTRAISAPSTGSINAKGVSVGFSTRANHALEKGAVWEAEAAAHYTLTLRAKNAETESISAAIDALRKKLLTTVFLDPHNGTVAADAYSEQAYLRKVVTEAYPLVLSVHSADRIASIITLKADVEAAMHKAASMPGPMKRASLRVVILGGAEAHLVAPQLASAGISVVLAPLLPHAQSWDQRRSLMGAPLKNGTAIDVLLDSGVLVAIGVEEAWETRELGWLAGWARTNGGGRLTEVDAFDLVGRNLYKMLGLKEHSHKDEWVVWEGSPLEIGCKIRAVGSMGRAGLWI